MFVLLRSSSSRRQVLALAVANRYFRQVSTTRAVVVRQIRRVCDRRYSRCLQIVCVSFRCNLFATIRRQVDRGRIVRRLLRHCYARQLRAALRRLKFLRSVPLVGDASARCKCVDSA